LLASSRPPLILQHHHRLESEHRLNDVMNERHAVRGSTLTDCSVGIVVSALLLGTIVTPLQRQVENRKIEQTAQLLAKARSALLGYAAAHGYFPCPATSVSNGQEPVGTDHATGACPTYYGFLPAATLGLEHSDSLGYAIDAWGSTENRIRYAVINQAVASAVNTRAFTRTNGMRTAAISNLSDTSLSLFHVCGSAAGVVSGTSCGTAPTLVSTTPVVVWSVGGNATSGGVSADEAQNPNPNGGSEDRIFVSRVRNEVAGYEFDDIVAWIPMPLIVTRMVAAGQLP
jgi:type II secretory pathway pseudopilin PulG